ncbi:Uncharacterized conserved protein, DUF885 familyt [Bryocella elongata]|uniref:Uncharacterized conserved protein, DUF885 familyt n=1 Tax=Bryocella elongata TaxID=863522 RepID=A0A1H6C7E6_9BACT|nr:DUF885 domain-containing protein [Bryocella elongata]SEG68657.1 Uncharacterized conserved protein, DUF885 familyt [Bryocella elongata]
MRNLLVLAAASACALGAVAQQSPVAERVKAQNALFDEVYKNRLKSNPMMATSQGDYSQNDQLGDFSLAHIVAEHKESDGYLARIRAISPAGMSADDLLNHQLFERGFVRADENFALKEYEMPLNMQGGIHTSLAELPVQVPLDTVKHYEDYISRLKQIPRALDQTIEILKAGEKDGLVPVKFIAEKFPAQADGVVAADPFLMPEKKFPASFSDADKQRLTAEINDAVEKDVLPAYKKFAAFLRDDYAPHGRTQLSIESLPQGKARYALAVKVMTTTDLTPSEIHELGLKEVARITAEMEALAHKQGYKTLDEWRTAINNDPKWRPTSEEQIVADFKRYIDQMQPKLPELFGLLPKQPVTVEAIPAYNAGQATHYSGGTPDGRRPGRVSVAVADPTHRSLVDDEAVAYHEGVPGHHLQISVAQNLTGIPKFRQRAGGSAYTEGWALYAEELGKEVGFYQDPVSDYGRLSSELFRAVRLVVDTGIHDQGWTRQQVIDYMHKNDVNDVQAQQETDRYISWPAQALAYKMGQLTILKLRTEAQQQLGPKFNLKAFHDEILGGGALPLDLLQERVEAWIKLEKAKP